MRREWGWALFSFLIIYVACVFAGMVRNPRYTGLPRLSVANFVDAQPFAVIVSVVLLIWVIVDMRRRK